ncbi:MAG: DUF2007 domain-containing protein [Planctomycetaceae bacterium]
MPGQPICLLTFQTVHEAHIARSFLEAHGISCAVTGDQLSTTLSWYGNAAKRIELIVDRDQANEAIAIIRELDAVDSDQHLWGTAPPMDWRCPQCTEVNADTFDECWSCGQDRPADAELVPGSNHDNAPAVPTPGVNMAEPVSVDDSPYRAPLYQNERPPHEPKFGLLSTTGTDDDLSARALRAACFGLVVPVPMAYYSLYLCLESLLQGTLNARILLALMMSLPIVLWLTVLLFGGMSNLV